MAWKRSGVQFPLAPLRTLSELVFLDIARKTEMPTDTGNGNSAEIHFFPTTTEDEVRLDEVEHASPIWGLQEISGSTGETRSK